MAKNPWILKILSGTHVGAEVVLSTTEAVLGKEESCDLVLDDVSLAGRHISLHSDESGASLSLLNTEKPIYIDGEEFSEKSIRLKAFQVIRIGTLFLTVGPADAEWPTIDLLLDNKTDQAKDKAEQTADDDDSKQDNNDAAARQTAEQESKDSRNRPHSRWVYLYLLASGTLLAGIVLIVLAYMAETVEDDESHKNLTVEQTDYIMLTADKYGAKIELNVPPTDEALTEITGYIGTELDRRRFLNQLGKIDIHAEIDIISSEKIMHAINSAIGQFLNHNQDSHVEVATIAASPGDFVLKGYVKDKAKWLKVLESLKHDVKNYHSLQDEVETEQDRIEILKQMLSDAQLGEQVEISVVPKGVVLSGSLTQEEKKRLTNIKESFNRKFNSEPEALSDTQGGDSNDPAVKLDIRAIGFGENPHIIMRNGQRYTEGSQLNNGYTIARITTSFIVLKKGDKSNVFYLNSD